jgi:hypothetical protein
MQTGNTVDFSLDHDVKAMRSHPDYEEVLEEVKPVVTIKEKKTAVTSKEA